MLNKTPCPDCSNQSFMEAIVAPLTCVVHPQKSPLLCTPPELDLVIKHVQAHGRRLVTEGEIGKAVIWKSTDRFCNAGMSYIGSTLMSEQSKCVSESMKWYCILFFFTLFCLTIFLQLTQKIRVLKYQPQSQPTTQTQQSQLRHLLCL